MLIRNDHDRRRWTVWHPTSEIGTPVTFLQWSSERRRRRQPTRWPEAGPAVCHWFKASARALSPAVLVIHENRGLNPYIEDIARRAATEGFVALAPDGLSPVGGYPGNDDDGRTLQAGLDQGKLRTDMVNSARYLKTHALSTGKLGVTGFCWGGSTTNFLAATLGSDLQAGVPFYGAAADTASVPSIKAPLLINYAEKDERIDSMWPAYEAALKAAGAQYEMYIYARTQ